MRNRLRPAVAVVVAIATLSAPNTLASSAGRAPADPTTLAVTSDIPFAADIDGDTKADLIVWRPGSGTWYWLTSSSGYDYAAQGQKQWGNQTLGDVPLVGDMDADGKADLIVWRASTGTWYWLSSSSGYDYATQGQKQWGNASLGDVPFVADMSDHANHLEPDRKADLVVWRASTRTWYWLSSRYGYDYNSAFSKQWGPASAGDVPLIGDMDGDCTGSVCHRGDLILWHAATGIWEWSTSRFGPDYQDNRTYQWGNQSLGDVPRVADMDGNGRGAFVIWRASTGTWYWVCQFYYTDATIGSKQWGSQSAGDIPLPADIDGDGKADLIVWRASTGTWFWLTSSSAYDYAAQGQKQWGSGGTG